MARRDRDYDDDYLDDDDDRPARRGRRREPQGSSAGLVAVVIALSVILVAGIPLGAWLLLRNNTENKDVAKNNAAPVPQKEQPGFFMAPGQQPQPPQQQFNPPVQTTSGPQIGKVAPEIEGEDIDGKRFKLSDYRGKVVVLDFWGHW